MEDSYSVGINQTLDWANKRGARAQVGVAAMLIITAATIGKSNPGVPLDTVYQSVMPLPPA